jgi:hypothetical protein
MEYWNVVRNEKDWPAIQSITGDAPFIGFLDQTSIGERGATRWATIICAWMNEQMRLGFTENEPINCDPMLAVKVKELEGQLVKMNIENQRLKDDLDRANEVMSNVRDALRS